MLQENLDWRLLTKFLFSTLSWPMRDLRLLPWSRWDLLSLGILRSVYWQFLSDVLGHPIDLILKCQDGTDKLSQNIGMELPLLTVKYCRRAQILLSWPCYFFFCNSICL